MVYLNESHIKELGFNWEENIATIQQSVECMVEEDYAQPIKPYLRYKEKTNRIIAMPAFVGGEINKAGIKWIASFPNNIKNGLPRAHSVVILNDADTGVPSGILNSGSVSAIRTASVSGMVMKHYLEAKKPRNVKVGIIGFGPIGQCHLDMCYTLLKDNCEEIKIFDLKGVNLEHTSVEVRAKITLVDSWEEAYKNADVFMTCTVSKATYIDMEPKPGSLHLNVSLRDYKAETYEWFSKAMIVDNWEEICRENTDVENFHLEKGLQKEDTKSILDLVNSNIFSTIEESQAVMFNPMGMAAFDIAISENYVKRAIENKVGVFLN
ncbi:2,3-diaminopropionate biosynthesis protein SbnB [Tenacibaculum sp. M341]|uniref:2,3-diaminopropionate biosynthesis protein SbnB n=1 Tax=Tenacibaculum sp. M341 TaxID=2530339 RepID=UPI001045F47B|nr:2,3-diaminopropionate biosynthesis protein SbnB [Tenacibaculum sp. M341]TCI85714.1 2,3-diaminopropionate biosynthesis protein SbnB [Tenacibaculum sp. M341]